jgi:hypothetical protein
MTSRSAATVRTEPADVVAVLSRAIWKVTGESRRLSQRER